MKEIFQKLKLPIIVMAVLFGGLIVYNFTKKPASTTLLAPTGVTSPSGPDINFLPLLIEVQGVTLDEKLFLDPVFRALEDHSLEIREEAKGKVNPFSSVLKPSPDSLVESLGFKDVSTTTVKKK